MAASAVGGWMASACITKLVDRVCSFAGDQYKYQRDDAKEKLRGLENSLRMIKAMMHQAESLQIKNPNMKELLEDVRDAAHRADDILDLFNYRVLEAKTVAEDKVITCSVTSAADAAFASSTTTTTTSTTNTTTSTASSSSTAKRSRRIFDRFLFSDEDLNELVAIVDRFGRIAGEMPAVLKLMDEFKPSARRAEEMAVWRRTTSLPINSKVVGRDNEVQHLTSLLLKNEESCQPYSVLSVVGIGGVGKTTLVQRVYNNHIITGYFDFMAWLYVSDKFDVERLTIEMVQSFSYDKPGEMQNIRSFDLIQRMLQEKVKGRRILLVLDDVWNEMSSQWENLCKPLQFASKGSKVIVTTRSQDVADMTGTTEVINLKGLENEDYWGLFTHCAFGDADPKDFLKLENIGRQLAKRLGGSPLAAKTIGAALKPKLEEDHWRSVSTKKLWQVEQKGDGIIPALKLSYDHLPEHLKRCFVYCALFPKNYRIRGDMLVQMWRAQGYIDKETPDDAAFGYINDLERLSFIQKVNSLESYYVVHELLHDLAESVSNGEHFRIEGDFDVKIPRKARHLYVNARNMIKVFMQVEELKTMNRNIRSLVVCKDEVASGESSERFPWSNFVYVLQETLKSLKSLRVLVLHSPEGILPDSIDHLVHLRYLDIQGSSLADLPRSLFRLYHLQGLNLQLRDQEKIKKPLANSLSRLINLRYLKAHPEIIASVEWIGKLTSLQELKEYHVKSDIRHDISQLKELKELRGQLTIKNLDRVRGKAESLEARLSEKQHLNKLSLCWNHLLEERVTSAEQEDVFEGLQPHPNLKELHVVHYTGTRSPHWLSKEYVWNLHYIELSFCHFWETLPPLGELPFLRILKIRYLPAVEHIDGRFCGGAAVAFPSLEELLFEHMDKWNEWSGVDSGRDIFPRLRSISIKHCNRLKGPLPLPASINGIKIWPSESPSADMIHSGSERTTDEKTSTRVQLSLDRIYFLSTCLPASNLAFICILDVSFYFLGAFTKEQEKWLQQLTLLKDLRFTDCPRLRSLPSTLIFLPVLESLYIEKCPLLMSFPQTGFPLCLKKLSIIRCHNDLNQLCDRNNGSYWPMIRHISTIVIHGEDIEGASKVRNSKKRKRRFLA